MRIGRSIVLICLLLAGCSSSEPSGLIGKWQLADAESVSQRVISEDDVANQGISESKMSIEFRVNGTLVTQTKMGSIDSSKEGTWRVIRTNSDNTQVTIECTLQLQTTEHIVEMIDSETIKWVPPNMAGTTRQINFERVN